MHSKFMKNRVENGHTKGVILGDKFTSLWLVHSVPRFPPIPDCKYLRVDSLSDYPLTREFSNILDCLSSWLVREEQAYLHLDSNTF